jgi:HEPN domain-containing protein
MTEANNPLAWVTRAEEDFALARAALRRKQPLASGACFHAQQCAEKYMKALLISKGADFPKTHDLLLLNNLCSIKTGPNFCKKISWSVDRMGSEQITALFL